MKEIKNKEKETNKMVEFYSSHCPKCIVLENLMKQKGIEYKYIDNSNIYMPIAEENNIMSMPFAKVDGKILNTKELQNYIMEV